MDLKSAKYPAKLKIELDFADNFAHSKKIEYATADKVKVGVRSSSFVGK